MEEHYWKSTTHKEWIYWSGICSEERNTGLNHIKDCIDSYGFITDHHLFSDISISLNIAIEEKKITALYHSLSRIIHLDAYETFSSDSISERTIMLNITFSKSTGDMRIEVPAVPG